MSEKIAEKAGQVIVTHPGTQYSYQTALALQESGLLQKFITGFYFKNNGIFEIFIKCFPRNLSMRLRRQLLRRRMEMLDDSLIQTFPLRELLYVLVARSRYMKRWAAPVIRWRNEVFDTRVAQLVRSTRPRAVIGYDSCALNTFKAGREVGSVCILDQSIGHITSTVTILREEAKLHPEFADSMGTNVPDWLIDRCTAEALTADYVLAPSDYVRNTLTRIGVDPEKIVTLPFGVDIHRFQQAAKDRHEPFRILFVGQIGQRKGIKYLLEAFKGLHLANAELTLVGGIINSGSGLKPYRDYFHHVRNVPHHEVHRYFQSADVFVFPSLHEGSAIVIYEALAAGLPVITTPNAGSVVRHGVDGFILPIRDVEALQKTILLLYENEELRNEMGMNARERAEEFTWGIYRKRLSTILTNILNKHERRRVSENIK